jgi:hypothetical protein
MRMWMCFALVTALGCKGSQEDPGGPVRIAPPVGSAGAVAVAGAVKIVLNDTIVATLSPKELAAWPRLDSLYPPNARRMGTWQTLYVKGANDKVSEINKPGDTHREQIIAVFLDKQGAPAFGIFDPVELAKKGEPAVRVDGLREIRLKMDVEGSRGQNDHGSTATEDPSKLKVTFKTPKGEQVMTGETLLALPREQLAGEDAKGWKLTTLLTAMQITAYEKLVLTDAGGMNLSVEKKDFDDTTTVPFVKLNRQGALRFKIYAKAGEGWKATGDLRALTTIEVIK